MTLNDCKLAGFIGSAPELRFLPSGVPVTNMRVGQSYVYTDAKQQSHRKTNWFSVVTYGPVAEIAKTFKKGDNIILDGQLETREWQGQDGSKRKVVEVIARNIGKLERAGDRNGAPEEADQHEEGQPSVDAWPIAEN